MEELSLRKTRKIVFLLKKHHRTNIQKALTACSIDHVSKHRLRVRRLSRHTIKILRVIDKSTSPLDKTILKPLVYPKNKKYTIKWFTVNGEALFEDKFTMIRAITTLHHNCEFFTYDEDQLQINVTGPRMDIYTIYLIPEERDFFHIFNLITVIFRQFKDDQIYNFRMYFVIKKFQKKQMLFLKCSWHVFPKPILIVRTEFNTIQYGFLFNDRTLAIILQTLDPTLSFDWDFGDQSFDMEHYHMILSFESPTCYHFLFHCLRSTLKPQTRTYYTDNLITPILNLCITDVIVASDRFFYAISWSTRNCLPVEALPTKKEFTQLFHPAE